VCNQRSKKETFLYLAINVKLASAMQHVLASQLSDLPMCQKWSRSHAVFHPMSYFTCLSCSVHLCPTCLVNFQNEHLGHKICHIVKSDCLTREKCRKYAERLTKEQQAVQREVEV